MSAELSQNFSDLTLNIDLVEGSGGTFDVQLLGDGYDTADRIVFSKHIKGRFPEEGEITKLLK